MNSMKFYINKYSYLKKEITDISFIPMLMRRKLDTLGKAGLCTLYNVFDENKNTNLIFASQYGDIERVLKLIQQRKEEGEISPTGFSFSVHNATIGLFSLLNSIKTSYNSISAGENTLSYGILEAILTCKEKPTIFCFTENKDELQSVSFYCSTTKLNEHAQEIMFIKEINKQKDSFDDFISFLENKKQCYCSDLYTLKRG